MSRFELVVDVKNAKGEPTGIKKSIATDSADALAAFWLRYQGKARKKKTKAANLPVGKEAEKLAQDVGTYADEKQHERETNTEK